MTLRGVRGENDIKGGGAEGEMTGTNVLKSSFSYRRVLSWYSDSDSDSGIVTVTVV